MKKDTNKIEIDRKKFFKLYMREVRKISDILEDKSVFSPQEIIDIASYVLENNTKSLIKQVSNDKV
jgi:hypothetical protein